MENATAAHEAIERWMTELGMSRAGFAKAAGISPSTLTRYLGKPGHSFFAPTVEKLRRFYEAEMARRAEQFARLRPAPTAASLPAQPEPRPALTDRRTMRLALAASLEALGGLTDGGRSFPIRTVAWFAESLYTALLRKIREEGFDPEQNPEAVREMVALLKDAIPDESL